MSKKPKSPENKFLAVEVKAGLLTVSIGITSLRIAAEGSDQLQLYDRYSGEFGHCIVTDEAMFAREVMRALQREEEDGTTLVHRMFDSAFDELMNSGLGESVAGPEWCTKEEWADALALKKERDEAAALARKSRRG